MAAYIDVRIVHANLDRRVESKGRVLALHLSQRDGHLVEEEQEIRAGARAPPSRSYDRLSGLLSLHRLTKGRIRVNVGLS
jgi:hypothetical protein